MRITQFLLAGCLFTGTANADTTLIYNTKDGQEHSRMFLTDGKLKMTNKTEVDTAIIFDSINTSFTIVNHSDKSYMVFNQKQIEALGDVSKMIDKLISEQLAQMPEAQRAQMRGMIESMVKSQMPKSVPLPSYSKNGKSNNYNGFDCEVVVKEVKGKNDGEFCVTEYSNLGISDSEYSTVNTFMKIAEKMAAQFGQDQSMNFDAIGQVVPVYYDMEKNKGFLTAVNDDDLPNGTFDVPSGYKQESLPKELF